MNYLSQQKLPELTLNCFENHTMTFKWDISNLEELFRIYSSTKAVLHYLLNSHPTLLENYLTIVVSALYLSHFFSLETLAIQ